MTLTVEETLQTIFAQAIQVENVLIPIHEAKGRVLQEDISQDRNLPPIDTALMEGIAIQYQAWQQGNRAFKIENIQEANSPQIALSNPYQAIRVKEGAAVPQNTDTIIPFAHIRLDTISTQEWATVGLNNLTLSFQENIIKQGHWAAQASIVLKKGTHIDNAEIALLASVGKGFVKVSQIPKTVIISIGENWVDIGATPTYYQARRASTYALQAALETLALQPEILLLPDNEDFITRRLTETLQHYDFLIFLGGFEKNISAILEKLGVHTLCKQIAQNIAPDFYFGRKNNQTIMGISQSPLALYLNTAKYIIPYLYHTLGTPPPPPQYAPLNNPIALSNPSLTYFVPVSIAQPPQDTTATPMPIQALDNFVNLLKIDAFMEINPKNAKIQLGQKFPLYRF